MNTVSFTPQLDGQVRVTIHSSGERDQSAIVSGFEFKAAYDAWSVGDTQPATKEES